MLPVRETQSNFRDARQLQPDTCSLVQLDFDRLTAYELVRDQFWGLQVRFEGAIALYPSNPAFAGEFRDLVMMPIGETAGITADFDSLQQLVKATLIGARQIKVTAYSRDRQPLSRYFVGSRQSEQPSERQSEKQSDNSMAAKQPLPEHTVELSADGMARVVFESAAPFILKQFCFG